VPVVASSGAGTFRSRLPLAELYVAGALGARADLGKYLQTAPDAVLEAGFGRYAKIVDASGHMLACVENDGDGFTIAEVELADETPQPSAPQPKMRLPTIGYWAIDGVGTNSLIPMYRDGVRRQWGAHMAPIDPRTKMWVWAAAGLAALGVLVGYVMGRKR
jgi:hypothetical protein